jgi:alpha-amylase
MRENGLMMQYFEWYMKDEGSLWKALKEDAPHLKNLGIRAVWIPPCFKATGTNDVGYGVYDVYDLGEFNQKNSVRTKYGTKQELHEAIDALHANGLQVYADIVINHKAGADETQKFKVVEVNPEDRTTFITDEYEIEGWTKFTFPGRQKKYSDFSWSWEHFSGTDFNNANGKSAIYLIRGENHNWMQGVSYEKGNYDFLMFADIDYNHPQVREETLRWIDWFIRETKVDGVRLDAIKHINDWFMRDFVDHIRDTFGQGFYCFGEYWSTDRSKLENYMRNTEYQIDLFDVPLHYKFYQASLDGKAFDMRTIFDHTLVKAYKDIAVTFVDSHDTQPQEALQSFVAAWFKPLAYALILLRRDGYPILFYGDYYGIGGKNPIPGQKKNLDKLSLIRRENAYGEQFDYFDHNNVVGWVRAGDSEKPNGCAVLLSSGDAGEKTMFVGEMHAGEVWVDRMGFVLDQVTIDEKGQGVFKTNAGSVSVYVQAGK